MKINGINATKNVQNATSINFKALNPPVWQTLSRIYFIEGPSEIYTQSKKISRETSHFRKEPPNAILGPCFLYTEVHCD